jgi:hypothetical protein
MAKPPPQLPNGSIIHDVTIATFSLRAKGQFPEKPHLLLTPQDNERLSSNVQTLTTPGLLFHALLTQDGAQRLELART